MIRKMLIVAAAVAMPVSVVAASAGTATAAGPPPINATTLTVQCTGISATASFSPALTMAGSTPSTETTKIKGAATGCTASGGVTVTGVKITGTITSAASNHSCTGLTGATPEAGTLTASWKTGQKLTSKTSTLNTSTVTGATGANGHATFAIAFSSASGDFQGTDAGALDSTDNQTVLPLSGVIGLCSGPKGMTKLAIQANANVGAGPAINLG